MNREEVIQVLNIQQLKEVYPRIRDKVNPEIRDYIDKYLEVEDGEHIFIRTNKY